MSQTSTRPIHLSAEALAYWYLRLNGFLTIRNFVVHPDAGSDQETDVDVLGVRFPYRAENLVQPMQDDDLFARFQDRPLLVITEITTQDCKLNRPWTDPDRRNMLRVLCAIGAFSAHRTPKVAEALHDKGFYEDDRYCVSLLCVGKGQSSSLKKKYPDVPQVLLDKLKEFIYNRFRQYHKQKASHPQWDADGHKLWDAARKSKTLDTFAKRIIAISQ